MRIKRIERQGKKQNIELIDLIVFMIAISILGIVISKTTPAVLVRPCGQDSGESRYFCFGKRDAQWSYAGITSKPIAVYCMTQS